jgi:hypothetical protein
MKFFCTHPPDLPQIDHVAMQMRTHTRGNPAVQATLGQPVMGAVKTVVVREDADDVVVTVVLHNRRHRPQGKTGLALSLMATTSSLRFEPPTAGSPAVTRKPAATTGVGAQVSTPAKATAATAATTTTTTTTTAPAAAVSATSKAAAQVYLSAAFFLASYRVCGG